MGAMRHEAPWLLLVALRNALLYVGERRWRITDVVGAEDGLGVECLSGSGAIASAYSRAFREGFTITLVSGRTVGIGAYLARLGRRFATLFLIHLHIHHFLPCSALPCQLAWQFTRFSSPGLLNYSRKALHPCAYSEV